MCFSVPWWELITSVSDVRRRAGVAHHLQDTGRHGAQTLRHRSATRQHDGNDRHGERHDLARAGFRRASSVMKFKVPRSSSAPIGPNCSATLPPT
jgi:hypothetical protein